MAGSFKAEKAVVATAARFAVSFVRYFGESKDATEN